jgi:hypothetical protein
MPQVGGRLQTYAETIGRRDASAGLVREGKKGAARTSQVSSRSFVLKSISSRAPARVAAALARAAEAAPAAEAAGSEADSSSPASAGVAGTAVLPPSGEEVAVPADSAWA